MTTMIWEDQNLRSHARIAARLAQYAAQDLLYVRGTGWHYWDGKRWAIDHDNVHAYRQLSDVVDVSWDEAKDDKDLRQDLISAMTSHGSRGVLEMTRPHLYAVDVDPDPYLLNCENGTLDLHTMTLRPHNSMDRITKVTHASYVPGTESERWDKFLESALPDPQVRQYLQTYAGLGLIGQVIEHVLTIATGSGRNGKSVFAESLAHALGDYAIAVSADMLISSRYGAKKSAGELAAIMRLRGSRFVTMSELPKGVSMDESTTKLLTGGDTIEAKLMGQNPVNFEPSHSFLMLTNDLPKVNPDAQAVWDRLRVVPFDVSFRGREDHALKGDLQLAADAILTWAVAGLQNYQQNGLEPPARVVETTQAYHDDQDALSRFIAEECVKAPHCRVPSSKFSEAYNRWAAENQEEALTSKAITTKMQDRQWKRTSGGNRSWIGIGLLTNEEQDNIKSSQAADQGKGQKGHIDPVNRNTRDIWDRLENVPEVPSGCVSCGGDLTDGECLRCAFGGSEA